MKKKNTHGRKKTNGKSGNSRRGFAAMSKTKVKQIASMGGRASHGKLNTKGSDTDSQSVKGKY